MEGLQIIHAPYENYISYIVIYNDKTILVFNPAKKETKILLLTDETIVNILNKDEIFEYLFNYFKDLKFKKISISGLNTNTKFYKNLGFVEINYNLIKEL
jgi:hypothetical protein